MCACKDDVVIILMYVFRKHVDCIGITLCHYRLWVMSPHILFFYLAHVQNGDVCRRVLILEHWFVHPGSIAWVGVILPFVLFSHVYRTEVSRLVVKKKSAGLDGKNG